MVEMSLSTPIVLLVALIAPEALADTPAATNALEAFVGGALPPPPTLPFSAPVEAAAVSRMLDSGLVLGLMAAILGIGRLALGTWKDTRPMLATAVILGILMWTVVNPAFWEVEKVTADQTGVTVVHYQGEDPHIAWADIKDIRLAEGMAFPVFTDDRTLVLVNANGGSVAVPRFATGAEEIAALISARRP